MKSTTAALAIAVSAFTAIALFWAVILFVIVQDEAPKIIPAVANAGVLTTSSPTGNSGSPSFAASAVLTILVSILSAVLAVRLAFGRFKNEALWSKKLDAYARILDALHLARLEAERYYNDEVRSMEFEGEPNYTDEYKAHLAEMKKAGIKANAELKRLLDTGTLLISPRTTSYLREALKPREQDWRETPGIVFWETEEANLRKALDTVSEFARDDLDA